MAQYRDSVGNTYKSVPSAKHPPKQRGSSVNKVGRKKRQPAFGRWKDRFNAGKGLKHRRAAKQNG